MKRYIAILFFVFAFSWVPWEHHYAIGDEIDKITTIDDFFGTYVGVARDNDGVGEMSGERDIDMVITPFKQNGFSLEVVSVRLVNGRRDAVGVRRRVLNAMFSPSDKGIFLAEEPFDPFEEHQDVGVLTDGPIQWAYINGQSLFINTLSILESGMYEFEVYERRLTKDGMIIRYERMHDGKIVRRVEGHMVRAK